MEQLVSARQTLATTNTPNRINAHCAGLTDNVTYHVYLKIPCQKGAGQIEERRQPLQNILRGTEIDMIQKKKRRKRKDSLSKTWAKVKTGRVMEAEDRTATRTTKQSVRGGRLQTEIKGRKTLFL